MEWHDPTFPPTLPHAIEEKIKTICGEILKLHHDPENLSLYEEIAEELNATALDPALPLDYQQTLHEMCAFLHHLQHSNIARDEKRVLLDELHVSLTGFLTFAAINKGE